METRCGTGAIGGVPPVLRPSLVAGDLTGRCGGGMQDVPAFLIHDQENGDAKYAAKNIKPSDLPAFLDNFKVPPRPAPPTSLRAPARQSSVLLLLLFFCYSCHFRQLLAAELVPMTRLGWRRRASWSGQSRARTRPPTTTAPSPSSPPRRSTSWFSASPATSSSSSTPPGDCALVPSSGNKHSFGLCNLHGAKECLRAVKGLQRQVDIYQVLAKLRWCR